MDSDSHKATNSHNHNHSHNHHAQGATGNIKVAFFLNLAFTIIEIVGGLYTNSMAVLSDAVHDLGDSLSLGLSWYFEKLSAKNRSANFSYGYKRFSTLAALINSTVLLVGSGIIVYHAVPRLMNPEEVHTKGMLYLAIAGIVFNGLAAWRLNKGTSLNERVVMLHLLEDVLGWVAILAGSVIMMFFDVPWLDPLLSMLIALFIVRNAVKNLKASLKIFLQAVPEQVNIKELTDCLGKVPNVQQVHDVHVWSMDGQFLVLTAHLVVNATASLADREQVKEYSRICVREKGIHHATLELENPGEDCHLRDC